VFYDVGFSKGQGQKQMSCVKPAQALALLLRFCAKDLLFRVQSTGLRVIGRGLEDTVGVWVVHGLGSSVSVLG
jgi:hypothetical protein